MCSASNRDVLGPARGKEEAGEWTQLWKTRDMQAKGKDGD